MTWLDDVLYKNPILLWLGRMGWYNKVTATVPFARKQISARLNDGQKNARADLLSKFLRAKVDFPDVVDDRAVLGLTLSMVNAGSGTVATTITATIYYLLKNPSILKKLRTELDAQFPPPSRTASLEEWVVPFGKAQKLPYLDACIKETFRIHPSLGGQLMERITPPDGAIIAGEHIPGDVIISSNAWLVHRHKPSFGDDADVFRPERWLDNPRMSQNLLVFGAGPNTCIGKNIALLELYKIVPTILRAFNIEQVDQSAKWKIFNLGDPEPYDFFVRFQSRHG